MTIDEALSAVISCTYSGNWKETKAKFRVSENDFEEFKNILISSLYTKVVIEKYRPLLEKEKPCEDCDHNLWHDPQCKECNAENRYKWFKRKEMT